MHRKSRAMICCSAVQKRFLALFSKAESPAQDFHCVSADPDIGDLLAIARRAHKDFTRSPGFGALMNENLFVRFCHAVPHHPTHGTTGKLIRWRDLLRHRKTSGRAPSLRVLPATDEEEL